MPSLPRPVVRVTVPAKINLQLAVGPGRPDGFHDLRTLFHAVDLADDVIAADAPSISLSVSGRSAGVPTDDTNIAWRAAELLAREAGHAGGVRLRIHKRIPVAGGMAGGSADAAGTLLACRALWGVGVPDARLAELAAELGSDVPFALLGGTALGTGRGEVLTPMASEPLHWVIVPAEGGIPAGAAYRELDRLRAAGAAVGPAVGAADGPTPGVGPAPAVGDSGAALHNDLQAAALSLRPDLARTLQAGLAAGALDGIVSGSGPTCVFRCESAEHAASVGAALPGSLTAAGPAYPKVCIPGAC